MLRTSGSYLRKCVQLRDSGICHECGIDCIKLRKRIKKARKNKDDKTLEQLAREYPRLKHNRSYWEAHHVLAVKDGGGECGLSNLITLCIPCHLTYGKINPDMSNKKDISKLSTEIQSESPCPVCLGTGGKFGKDKVWARCSKCKGTGKAKKL